VARLSPAAARLRSRHSACVDHHATQPSSATALDGQRPPFDVDKCVKKDL
jgi:hypothetical protein